LDEVRIFNSLLKITIASVIMGGAANLAANWFELALPGHELYLRATRVFAAIGVGVLVLIGAARLLGIGEFSEAMNQVLRRLGRRWRGSPCFAATRAFC